MVYFVVSHFVFEENLLLAYFHGVFLLLLFLTYLDFSTVLWKVGAVIVFELNNKHVFCFFSYLYHHEPYFFIV
jgi:hypothetical protein